MRSGETTPVQQHEPLLLPADLAEAEDAFTCWPGPSTAADLVGSALSVQAKPASSIDAAHYLLATPGAPSNARDLARALLGEGLHRTAEIDKPELDFDAIRGRARELRRIIKAESRNAVRWVDLALAHTVLGHPRQAERELRTALALAGPNRFLLRAAARLYVHLDRPDEAHDLLTRDPAVLDDPWLAAAELSTASLAGTTSRHTRRARALIDDADGTAPLHLAELASQVATAELRAGRVRHARRLMVLALRDPTDNALAQAEWASANGLNLDRASLDRPRTWEARALRFSHEGDWQAASIAGLDWLGDQPFALEPAAFTSYAASVGAMDWKLAHTAAEAGLVANPDSTLLRNNLAFALANQDRPAEAAAQLDLVQTGGLSPREHAVVSATRGLIAFRTGQTAEGRRLYDDAINELRREHQDNLAALATVFRAREEVLRGTAEAPAAVKAAIATARNAGGPEALLWIERLAEDVIQARQRATAAIPRQISQR